MSDYELAIYKKALNEVAHILVTNAEGTITYVNDKVCKLSKYSREELIGQNNRIFQSGFHPMSFYANMYSELKQGKTFKAKFKNKAKDGTFFWLDATIIPFLDSRRRPYKFLTIRFDITDKLNEITLKEEFLSNISHELRTPLHGMLSVVDLLDQTKLAPVQKEYISHIKETSNHLSRLINDLLEVFKAESGKLQFESIPININDIAKSIIEVFRIKAASKDILLTSLIDKHLSTTLLGDPTRLRQILYNLLENALKYTDHGFITLQINVAENTNDTQLLEFSVMDTGKGIAKEKQQEIFEKYIQADVKDTRLHGGTGLGLSIVKTLIELQEGSLSLDSKYGSGTTFTFKLPFKKSVLKTTKKTGKTLKTSCLKSTKSRILIVDDDKMNLMIFEKQMIKFNYDYILVNNGFHALEKLEQETFDLVLLDMQMPGMTGDVVLQKIRNDFAEPTKHIPVICVSATVQPTAIQDIINAGANGHLLKPYHERELVSIINTTIKLNKTSTNTSKENTTNTIPSTLIKLDLLQEFADNDTNFIIELLSIFQSETPPLLESMKVNFKKDTKLLASQLHKYRSQISLLGMTELAEITKQLEKDLLENNNLADTKPMLNLIVLESKLALSEVESIICNLKTKSL